jgi:hypothetical protein
LGVHEQQLVGQRRPAALLRRAQRNGLETNQGIIHEQQLVNQEHKRNGQGSIIRSGHCHASDRSIQLKIEQTDQQKGTRWNQRDQANIIFTGIFA